MVPGGRAIVDTEELDLRRLLKQRLPPTTFRPSILLSRPSYFPSGRQYHHFLARTPR